MRVEGTTDKMMDFLKKEWNQSFRVVQNSRNSI